MHTGHLAGEYRGLLAVGTPSERCFSILINRVEGDRVAGTVEVGATPEMFGYERDFEAVVSNGRFHFEYQFNVLKWVYQFHYTVKIEGPWKIRAEWSNNHGYSGWVRPRNISRFDPVTKTAVAAPSAASGYTVFGWQETMSGLMAESSRSRTKATFPDDVRITPPGSDIPAAKAAFSGRWTGWMCEKRHCSVKVAVEQITAEGATVVYASVSDSREQYTDRLTMTFRGDELWGRLGGGAQVAIRLRANGDMELIWGSDGELQPGILTKILSSS